MERAMLVSPLDIDAGNARPVLSQAEGYVSRFPDRFDGWYLAGLCHSRMGHRRTALHFLTAAWGISPSPELARMVAELGGDTAKADSYARSYALRENSAGIAAFALLMAGVMTMASAVMS